MITMKFGGTSVGSPEAIERVVGIIEETIQSGKQVAVIVSAMSGVTDMLLQSVQNAVEGNRWGYLSLSKDIRFKHEDVVHQHLKPGAQREEILRTIDAMLKEHEEICQAIQILQEATPRIYDAVVSFGERLSSRVIAAVLQERGLPAQAYDAGQFLVTDDRHRDAEPLWDVTQERIGDNLRPMVEEQGIIPILTGFLGANTEGHITTLGRGGSDYSAAIFAAYLNAEELIIWTDVDGVMTTDPRVDPRARVLGEISYVEVGELAFYGAKVLHPKTVQPIVSKNIPMRVRNTFNLDAPGTLINGSMEPSPTVIKAVTSVRSVSMLTVSGRGMLGVPGIAGRTFLATAQAGASILMISQSSSEQSFCFTVVDDRAPNVKHAVESELSAEIERRDVDSIDVMSNVVIITAVGAGMRHQPGVAGRVFTTMGDHGVNVLAIAQGSSECSISFLVAEKDLEHAVVHLHDLALG